MCRTKSGCDQGAAAEAGAIREQVASKQSELHVDINVGVLQHQD